MTSEHVSTTRSTIPPSAAPGAVRLRKFTLFPYGKGGDSVSLSLYDTGVPAPHGTHYVGYRLYEHPAGTRRGKVVFEGAAWDPGPGPLDPSAIAAAIIDRHTVRPGDTEGEHVAENMTPHQLHWVLTHAAALRRVAHDRLAWSPAVPVDLRGDLQVTYSHRRDLKSSDRHRFALGVVSGAGHTRSTARAALGRAVGTHCGMVPEVFVGARTATVYVLYPHGAEYVLQPVNPTLPDAPLGAPLRFGASTPETARAAARDAVTRFEASPTRATPVRRAISVPPVRRPSARPSSRPAMRVGVPT